MEPQHVFPGRPDVSAEALHRKLAAYAPRERGDHQLDPTQLPPPPYRRAAVLIPLLQRADGLHVLFTQRAAHLSAHAGQVSFPGGRTDGTDKDDIATALREAYEEIGLAPGSVRILGRLDDYITRTGFRVVPVAGLVEAPQSWTPDTNEVAEIFEVPLAHILSPDTLQRAEMEGRPYYAMTWERFHIWGATAGMLRNFVDVIAHG